MAGVAIVAIPREDDPVWQYSSEKVPHMTLLFLGSNPANIVDIVDFVGHAANMGLPRFGMSVDRREPLGPDNADVLFFEDRNRQVADFRSNLLKNDAIRTAYDATPQFDDWTPHLTMGFPATPAKPDKREYAGFGWVQFDKIAVWTGDYEGPTFDLKDGYDNDIDVAMMSDTLRDILKHHGVKGMRWGVRRKRIGGAVEVTTSPTRKGIRARGGQGHPAHPDAVRAASARRKSKKSGVSSLSNKELQDLVTRLNLEQQMARLSQTRKSEGRKFAEQQLKQHGSQILSTLAKKAATKAAAAAVL